MGDYRWVVRQYERGTAHEPYSDNSLPERLARSFSRFGGGYRPAGSAGYANAPAIGMTTQLFDDDDDWDDDDDYYERRRQADAVYTTAKAATTSRVAFRAATRCGAVGAIIAAATTAPPAW